MEVRQLRGSGYEALESFKTVEGEVMVSKFVIKGLEWLLIAMLGLMVIFVFGNVVLRYGFNSGITFSEEVSRFLFVWITFLGSVLVLHDNGHLGVHMMTSRLPMLGKKICKFLSDLLTFICCVLLTSGAITQVRLGMDNIAPVSGIPLGVVYASCAVCGVGMGFLLLISMFRLVTGKMTEEELSPGEFDDLL